MPLRTTSHGIAASSLEPSGPVMILGILNAPCAYPFRCASA